MGELPSTANVGNTGPPLTTNVIYSRDSILIGGSQRLPYLCARVRVEYFVTTLLVNLVSLYLEFSVSPWIDHSQEPFLLWIATSPSSSPLGIDSAISSKGYW